MERVRHLGFSLGIRLQRGCRHSASDVEPIANVLFDPKHASQISILRLSCIPAGWMPMLSRLSHMHTLHLSQCPNPIEFCTPFSSSLESPVTLTHIEALELDIRVGLLEDSSPQHLKFPSLKTLCIQAAERPNLPDSLVIFCHRLSAALITLELMEFITCGDEFSRRLFCSGKSLKLETLKLIECDTFNLTSVVRALTPGEDHLNPKPLPSLRQLVLIPQPVVENGSEELEEFEAKSRGIVERALLLPLLHMLQKRGDGIHSRLRVQIPRLDFHCVPAARYGFYQLLKERRIEIYSTASRFNLGRQYSTDLELI
ncbi:hypothetical protein D9756_002160 [Leucocoprinus leucothites]|uniref:Uncharacterized protein n=1 Tax=Leucocoprinus leucothites TaxID=201217 RepID=A0A8H5GBA8_9AGAR|nr:hypothetical protein D9756_002160 [Leucoagaricus leucothites]